MKTFKSLMIALSLMMSGVAFADCQSDMQFLLEKPEIPLKSCFAELKQNPDDTTLQNNLGQVAFVMGELDIAILALTKSANQGDVYGQELLGSILLDHTDNKDDGLMWLQRASEQGSANAQYNLGFAYQTGEKVKQDYTLAMQWYQKSAQQNNMFAQYGIGLLYDKGWGVRKNTKTAKIWLSKSCDNGLKQACEYY